MNLFENLKKNNKDMRSTVIVKGIDNIDSGVCGAIKNLKFKIEDVDIDSVLLDIVSGIDLSNDFVDDILKKLEGKFDSKVLLSRMHHLPTMNEDIYISLFANVK